MQYACSKSLGIRKGSPFLICLSGPSARASKVMLREEKKLSWLMQMASGRTPWRQQQQQLQPLHLPLDLMPMDRISSLRRAAAALY